MRDKPGRSKPLTLAAKLARGAKSALEGPAKQKRSETQKQLAEARALHRQQVWDKLDSAKRTADGKRQRLERFGRGGQEGARARRDDDFEL